MGDFLAIPVSLDLARSWCLGRIGDQALILGSDMVLVPRRPAIYLMNLYGGIRGVLEMRRSMTWFNERYDVAAYFFRTNSATVQSWGRAFGAEVTFTEADGDQRWLCVDLVAWHSALGISHGTVKLPARSVKAGTD